MEITFFLCFCHWFNFNLDVSGAILLFSVTYVNGGDVLSPFPKEQTITSHECNPSGRKHCRPFNLWEGGWKPALGSWRLTNKKMHSCGALVWASGTFLKFLRSYVTSPGAKVSGSWTCVLLMDAPKDDCAAVLWHGRTRKHSAQLPLLIQCRTELGISYQLFSVLGSRVPIQDHLFVKPLS